MKWAWNNGFVPMLRNQEGEGGGGGGGTEEKPKGLVAGLEEFIDKNPGTTATDKGGQVAEGAGGDKGKLPVTTLDPHGDGGTPPVTTDDSPPPKAGETDDDDETDDDFDPGLPEIGKPPKADEKDSVKEPPEFNEQDFDAGTEKIVKAIEAAGHPGEAYREAREELKKYKKGEIGAETYKTRIRDLEKVNEELKEKAGQVDAMQDRVNRVTSRNAELLLEELPEYQEKVAIPHQTLRETVTALAEAREVPETEIWAAIKEPDLVKRNQAIDQLEEKIGARNALAVQQMATNIRVIAQEDQRMRKDAESIVQRSKEREATMSEEEKARRVSAFQSAAKQSFQRYAVKVPGFVDDTGNMTDLAKTAQARGVTVDVNELGSGDLGYMVFTAQALPQALRHIETLERENRDLRVAAGEKAKDIAPGGSKKKVVKDPHINQETGQPRTFMEGFMSEEFDSAT